MFCDRCGVKLLGAPAFCHACGKSVPAFGYVPRSVPRVQERGRIEGHLRSLGILWIVISGLRLLPRLFVYTLWRHSDWMWGGGFPFLGRWVGTMVGLSLVGSVLGVVAGLGLLDRQPWARTLTIVLGCLSLIEMPLGTGLGIYTLWVLLPAQSELEYRQISRPA